jgi:thymidylate synthase
MKEGEPTNPRGMKTRELINARILVRDPQDRLIFDPARRMNIGFAIADWLQMMVGDDELDVLSHFAKGIKEFADPDDKKKVGGAYGPRLKTPEYGQIQQAIAILQDDTSSRQSVITIYDGKLDMQAHRTVVPCTLSLQFLIRHKKLHCIASMRSNDIVWGLTYDVFNFTMIQEYVARQLGLELGDYHHNAGSLHLYVDRDKVMAKNLSPHARVNMKMAPMPKDIEYHLMFLCFKEARDLSTRTFWSARHKLKSQYEKDLVTVARYWAARKAGEKYEANASYEATQDPALRKMLRLWPVT